MMATVKSVADGRDWTSPDGSKTLSFIDVIFEDGSKGTYTAKPDTAAAHVERLKGLIGQAGEFELEAKDYHNGQKQWKLKNYPGKPQPKPFGGGGGRPESWGYSEAGSRFREDQSNRRTALMCAKELATEDHEAHAVIVLAIAEDFYRWLSSVGAGMVSGESPEQGLRGPYETPAPASTPVAAPAVVPPSADGNGASAERGEPAPLAVVPLSRSASQQEAWTRYTTALTARGASTRQDLKAVRDLYVRPYCTERGLDFPPSQSWTAERLDAIAELLELKVALGVAEGGDR